MLLFELVILRGLQENQVEMLGVGTGVKVK